MSFEEEVLIHALTEELELYYEYLDTEFDKENFRSLDQLPQHIGKITTQLEKKPSTFKISYEGHSSQSFLDLLVVLNSFIQENRDSFESETFFPGLKKYFKDNTFSKGIMSQFGPFSIIVNHTYQRLKKIRQEIINGASKSRPTRKKSLEGQSSKSFKKVQGNRWKSSLLGRTETKKPGQAQPSAPRRRLVLAAAND